MLHRTGIDLSLDSLPRHPVRLEYLDTLARCLLDGPASWEGKAVQIGPYKLCGLSVSLKSTISRVQAALLVAGGSILGDG